MAANSGDGQCDMNEDDVAETRCIYQEKFAEATVLKEMLDQLKNVDEDIRSQEVALQNFKGSVVLT